MANKPTGQILTLRDLDEALTTAREFDARTYDREPRDPWVIHLHPCWVAQLLDLFPREAAADQWRSWPLPWPGQYVGTYRGCNVYAAYDVTYGCWRIERTLPLAPDYWIHRDGEALTQALELSWGDRSTPIAIGEKR